MAQVHTAIVDAGQRALHIAAAFDFVADPGFGGYNAFVGRIRDLNHGRGVLGVSYDMFDALALQRFDEIAREAVATFGPGVRVWIEHAKGRLDVGGVAVVIAVGTPHRDEAFRACRQVIEAVKHTVPIWKQEHYEDGSSEWSEGCSLCRAD
ncbi:molybdopterin (MPT) converting factor, subunit 2 [Lysobacter xinjiangensis]|uniref:Molybdopterin synthase catalytic subunit n=1 Tax=Cognatilysobacter xinjiangensis TaxID=546892 RepID=A0ABQ3BTD4_9GAMM|nr:molybdenum cofactor biosynthesis protein MoaE [Lysobacter xinjiangensis]GGZ54594.1 molybdopterin (MPT) converting factor, subunit 2 [Lysobacter xinjiangensis]